MEFWLNKVDHLALGAVVESRVALIVALSGLVMRNTADATVRNPGCNDVNGHHRPEMPSWLPL
ncbi:hypothetical protein BDW75DRAFT_201976 [Aspergillus navahoensis]